MKVYIFVSYYHKNWNLLKLFHQLFVIAQKRYSIPSKGLFLFTCFDSQAQWSLPLSSHGLAYPYFQISLCIKETASTTWLNLEFNQKNVAEERIYKMGIIVTYEIATEWKTRKKQKQECDRTIHGSDGVVAVISIKIVPTKIQSLVVNEYQLFEHRS